MTTAMRWAMCAVMVSASAAAFADDRGGSSAATGDEHTDVMTSDQETSAPGSDAIGGGRGEQAQRASAPRTTPAEDKAARDEAAVQQQAEERFLEETWTRP